MERSRAFGSSPSPGRRPLSPGGGSRRRLSSQKQEAGGRPRSGGPAPGAGASPFANHRWLEGRAIHRGGRGARATAGAGLEVVALSTRGAEVRANTRPPGAAGTRPSDVSPSPAPGADARHIPAPGHGAGGADHPGAGANGAEFRDVGAHVALSSFTLLKSIAYNLYVVILDNYSTVLLQQREYFARERFNGARVERLVLPLRVESENQTLLYLQGMEREQRFHLLFFRGPAGRRWTSSPARPSPPGASPDGDIGGGGG